LLFYIAKVLTPYYPIASGASFFGEDFVTKVLREEWGLPLHRAKSLKFCPEN